jgi:hypothetical protein
MGGSKLVCLGQLPVRRPGSGSNVAERVPQLAQEQPPVPVVPQAYVDRASRVARLRRQLEQRPVSATAPKTDHELLEAQVAGVGRLLQRIAGRSEVERAIDGGERSLPRVHRQAATPAALHLADRRLRHADPIAEHGLGDPSCRSSPAELAAEAAMRCALRRAASANSSGRLSLAIAPA